MTVITNGYTAENGRQSSGLIRIVTKSGTNQLRGSGWYNARRDEWNANEYFRKKQGAAKPFFEVNVSGYSIGGPVVIPKLIDSRSSEKKVYFFLSQEFVDDVRPTSVVRTNLPTAAERRGDFSDTRIPNGTVQPIIDPRTGQPFPGNIIPQDRISPMGQRMLNLLPMPNGILNQQAGQQWTSNDAQDVQPIHKRTNFVTRIDAVLSSSQRVSMRAMFDRDDHTRFNRVAPGIGSVNNMFPGDLVTATHTKVLSSSMVHEMTAGFSHNHWGFRVGTGSLEGDDYTSFYRSSIGLDPPRLQPFGQYGDPHLGRVQLDEYPYLPNMTYGGGTRTNLATCAGGYNTTQCPNGYRPSGNDGPLPRRNENYRFTFQDDLSWTKGRHNFKFGFFTERNSKTEPGSNNYAGVYNFGHNADNPLSTGNGFANALLGVLHDLHGARKPHRSGTPALADRRVRAGQLAYHSAIHARLWPSRDPPRRALRSQRHECGIRSQFVGSEKGPDAVPPVLPGSCSGQSAVRSSQPREQLILSPVKSSRRPTPARQCPARAASPTACLLVDYPARSPAGTTTCLSSTGDREWASRGTSQGTAKPPSARQAGSSITSSIKASTCTTAPAR